MIVHTVGGLCNRLRVILSYREKHGAIEVLWQRDDEVAGAHFLDVFAPLGGVRFVDQAPDVTTGDALPHGDWHHGYRDLMPSRPAPRLALPYAAVHIRRTDHVALAREVGTHTDDKAFAEWIIASPHLFIAIATDNAETQAEFAALVRGSGRVPLFREIAPSSAQRHTTLAHAVDDLFMCAGASDFMGSGESSYSEAIRVMRRIGGWWT